MTSGTTTTIQAMDAACSDHEATARLWAELQSAVGDAHSRTLVAALLRTVTAQHDAVSAERDAVSAERDAVSAERDVVSAERDKLQQQVDHLTRMLFGRRSEKLRPEELGQLVLALGGSGHQAAQSDPCVPGPEAPTQDEEQEERSETSKRKQRNHPGRTRLSPDLERIVTEVPVPDEERTCQCCGATMQPFGHLDCERVEYVPAKLVVHVERREKLGCKACGGDATTAERSDPAQGLRRCGTSLLAQLIEAKCDDALPIYRQRDQLSRLGFEVPQNTLYGYFAYATDLLWPVAETTLSFILGDSYCVALDDTSLRVLDRTRPGGIYKGHLWCFMGSGPMVAYGFTETWEAHQVVPWISAIEGFIQCDDYKGYGSQVDGPDGQQRILVPPERRLGCMMHVRRRFYKALSLGDRRAQAPIAFIRDLYDIEAEAKLKNLDAEARTKLRADKSIPLLDSFDQWVDDWLGKPVPSSPLGRAVGYALQQRPFIRRCFSDGRFEIDNGRVERAIREPAIGRKNFLFTGSAQAAKRLAGAYTLVQSCRNLGFPARPYLIDVLDKLERGWPLRRIAELVPDRWAQLHRPAALTQ